MKINKRKTKSWYVEERSRQKLHKSQETNRWKKLKDLVVWNLRI